MKAKGKKKAEKAINLDTILFNCRDYLRAARNSGSFFEKVATSLNPTERPGREKFREVMYVKQYDYN